MQEVWRRDSEMLSWKDNFKPPPSAGQDVLWGMGSGKDQGNTKEDTKEDNNIITKALKYYY